jgi:hypothetical protein
VTGIDPRTGPAEHDPEPRQRFAPRAVALREGSSMLRETLALLGAAPGRLLGLYLLVFLPLQFIDGVRYLEMPLGEALAAVAFTGFFSALEAVRDGRRPNLLDLLEPWRLSTGKVLLLAASGLAGVAFIWLVWWLDLGTEDVQRLLSSAPQAARDASDAAATVRLALAQRIEYAAAGALLNLPLLLLQPLCVLKPWSATRTLAANLIASLVNWRWAAIISLAVFALVVAILLAQPASLAELLLSVLAQVALGMFAGTFTLVLMHRTLD